MDLPLRIIKFAHIRSGETERQKPLISSKNWTTSFADQAVIKLKHFSEIIVLSVTYVRMQKQFGKGEKPRGAGREPK